MIKLPESQFSDDHEVLAAPEVEGPATDAQMDLPPEEEPVADFDPDVASIFTEEATELLEVCESQLAAWRNDSANTEYPAALKRPLHTPEGRCAHGGHHRHGRFEP